MGVPKFYRWISERYPCLSEVVKEYQVPEFDNLYLDMNGIIHVCSHPNDDDPHFRITEEQIFKDIFHYIEVLFRIVRPRKVFFMAVDGVAPRAKMNQQRGRRFRSAKEAEENIKKALKKGEMLPEEKRFDSNCITPGTKFMVRLQEQLEYMVKSKTTSDPAWQGIRIYLSGHETPGEGEHKITEFIRHERMRSDYDPNTRHCLYGLDADLMMLGLCSHEPHFSLLREEVRFTGKKKQTARTPKPEETTFHLLHLSLMREYIDHEFESLKHTIPFKYDLEAIIDDWVLMGFLVGNDFIPHLPHLHIAHNALPMLYQTYMRVLPTLDGYLNESGIVNLRRFEKYLEVLSQFDLEKFQEVYADFKWLESKTGKRKPKNPSSSQNSSKAKSGDLESFGSLEDEASTASSSSTSTEQKSIQVVKELSIKQGLTSGDSEVESVGSQDDTATYELEFQLFKRNYYQEKLHFKGTEAEVAKIAYEYILAIQWICHYYYNGVQSWSWYYPYHYAPFLSDLRNLNEMKLKYDMASPFLPYEQLLAVLPAASKECLPESFWNLMCSETSPIIDYYPLNFTCDLNGKQQEWEAVVLIPFIDENRLLSAMVPCLKQLKGRDKERNRHSGCQLYTYDSNLDFYVKSSLTGIFPNIAHCKAKLEVIPLHSWSTTNVSDYVKGVLPGCRLSVFYPGFPTLYHLPHKSLLKKQGVKVFQMPSRNENMILEISPPEHANKEDPGRQPYRKGDTVDDIAKKLLGTSIYVSWPHMEEAKVVAVADEKVKYEVTEHIHASGTKGSKHKIQRKTVSKEECQRFWQDVDSIAESYLNRKGVDVGYTDFLVYAQPLLGRKYVCGLQGQITLEKQWATKPGAYALQATVKDISVKDPTFQQFKGMEELYPTGSIVFMLGQPYYGCQGKVVQVSQGMTSIEFATAREPDIDSVIKRRQRLSSMYYPGWELGTRLGISNYLVSRITGTIFVFYPSNQKWQVGLNLRFTRENCGIAGYTKLFNGEWRYSEAVEKALIEYMEKFPDVLTYLQSALKKNETEFDAAKMVRKREEIEVKERLKELSTWLKSLDSYHGDKVNEYSDILEPKVVSAVLEKVEECKGKKPLKPVQITLRPHVLHRPLAHQGTLIPDKSAQHRLLDRIVNVRDGYTVPLGMRGTIIGIHKQPGQDILFDVVFDEEFLGGLELGGRCPKRRGYRMPECALINLSHGVRMNSKDQKPTAVVRPQNKQFTRPFHQQNQSQRTQSPGGREWSPRHPRPRFEPRHQPRQFFRPQSAPHLSPRQPSIMQRPSSMQTSGQGQTLKPQSRSQGSNSHIIDTLWNTLKEQNQKPDGPTPSSGSPLKSQQESSPEPKSVPTITAPKTEAKAKSAKDSPRGSPAGFTSLSQAAKSLPKVKPSMQASKASEKNATTSTSTTATSAGETPVTQQQRTRPQQTSTNPTTTVTQSQSNTGKSDADHLNSLFRSIKPSMSHPGPPRLAFTPTQGVMQNRYPNQQGPPQMNFRPPHPSFHNFNPRLAYQNQPLPPFFNQPPFASPNPRFMHGMPPRFPDMFNTRPRGPTMFPHPASMYSQTNKSSTRAFVPLQVSRKAVKTSEGTQKLCEMLNSENENEDASSSKWSTGEEDDETKGTKQKTEEKTQNENENIDAENTAKKLSDLSVKDEVSDGDSVKDDEDYMERSTSVEDENPTILKKQTKIDDLVSLCTKCGMMPPIYTYFTTGEEQVVSTVQLWNGVRFSSHPQVTRDKAMEEAASHALNYLNAELRENRPVSTSPPSTLPYYVPVQNLVQPQYYAHQAAYAQPLPYAAASAQSYFVPSVPYTVLPPAPVVTIASDYQQAAIMHPQYSLGHQYAPYIHQYPPYVQLQVSPTRQPKGAQYHGSSAKPVVWNSPYLKDSYLVQDKASVPQTEFRLLDRPPTESSPTMEQKQNFQVKEAESNAEGSEQKSVNTANVQKKQQVSKPKLAISFNKDKNED